MMTPAMSKVLITRSTVEAELTRMPDELGFIAHRWTTLLTLVTVANTLRQRGGSDALDLLVEAVEYAVDQLAWFPEMSEDDRAIAHKFANQAAERAAWAFMTDNAAKDLH